MLLQGFQISSRLLQEGEAQVWSNYVEGLMHWSILTPILIDICDGLDKTSEFSESIQFKRLKSLFHRSLFGLRDGSTVYDEKMVIKMLDSGVSIYILSESAICTASTVDETVDIQQSLSTLPRSRLGLSICDTENLAQKITKWRDYLSHIVIQLHSVDEASFAGVVEIALSCLKATGPSIEVYIEFSSEQSPFPEYVTDILNQNEHLHVILAPKIKCERLNTANLSLALFSPGISSEETLQHDSIDYYLSQLKSDRIDGLVTTVVCDERNQCLGLVYSNQESITTAFLEKRGIYWSRSRQSLWRKGDSSGMIQGLLDMRLDCDRDALKMRVIQHGQPPCFCHLYSYSCWGHCNGGSFSEPGGLQHLQQTLQERKLNAPTGSYTKRLFEDSKLLQQKLLEEAQELVEADTVDDIAAEAADVMYFTMVRCIQAGVTVRDIEAFLDLRAKKVTRRPGNAKEWRTAQASQILGTSTVNNLSSAGGVGTSATLSVTAESVASDNHDT